MYVYRVIMYIIQTSLKIKNLLGISGNLKLLFYLLTKLKLNPKVLKIFDIKYFNKLCFSQSIIFESN